MTEQPPSIAPPGELLIGATAPPEPKWTTFCVRGDWYKAAAQDGCLIVQHMPSSFQTAEGMCGLLTMTVSFTEPMILWLANEGLRILRSSKQDPVPLTEPPNAE